MIVLDSTILAYAVGVPHPLADRCRRLVEAVRAGRVEATTTPEVIEEFTHIRARRRSREEAATRARDYAALLDPLIVVDAVTLAVGLRLFEDTPGLGAFDAWLGAAAITTGAEAVVSADRGFGAIRGLTHLDPASLAFEAWLADRGA